VARQVIGASADQAATAPAVAARHRRSLAYADQARRCIVRGVASAARAARRPAPLLLERAEGATVVDADGHRYVDYVMAFGPALLGHNPPEVIAAVRRQLERGVLFGSSHHGEVELAERICRFVPGVEKVAFAGSGSDAAALAVRLARAATGRPLVLKFEGQYHGWLDPLYVNVPGVAPQDGAGALTVVHGTAGLPAPPGVVVCRWNDLPALERTLADHGADVALVLMEPVACNYGAYDADPGYLDGARRLCDRHGCLLGFDEVITGFRLGPGGAQGRSGVTPDVTVLAKALGAGLPIGMVGGRAEVMAVADTGPVNVQGTANGSALSVAAAVAALDILEAGGEALYAGLDHRAGALAAGLAEAARDAGAPLVVSRVGSVLQLLWDAPTPLRRYRDVWAADPRPIADLAFEVLGRGVHALERGLWFVSVAHSDDDVARTIAAAAAALPAVLRRHEERAP
jgi:glutamate-1-semialdehyde 2,1-aminomutase